MRLLLIVLASVISACAQERATETTDAGTRPAGRIDRVMLGITEYFETTGHDDEWGVPVMKELQEKYILLYDLEISDSGLAVRLLAHAATSPDVESPKGYPAFPNNICYVAFVQQDGSVPVVFALTDIQYGVAVSTGRRKGNRVYLDRSDGDVRYSRVFRSKSVFAEVLGLLREHGLDSRRVQRFCREYPELGVAEERSGGRKAR